MPSEPPRKSNGWHGNHHRHSVHVPRAATSASMRPVLERASRQAVGITLLVAEAQRIGSDFRRDQFLEGAASKIAANRSGGPMRMWWPHCGQTYSAASRSRGRYLAASRAFAPQIVGVAFLTLLIRLLIRDGQSW